MLLEIGGGHTFCYPLYWESHARFCRDLELSRYDLNILTVLMAEAKHYSQIHSQLIAIRFPQSGPWAVMSLKRAAVPWLIVATESHDIPDSQWKYDPEDDQALRPMILALSTICGEKIYMSWTLRRILQLTGGTERYVAKRPEAVRSEWIIIVPICPSTAEIRWSQNISDVYFRGTLGISLQPQNCNSQNITWTG
jgi:hypothetical protein